MANIIYSSLTAKNDPMFGKFDKPIRALIEHESNLCEKEKNILDYLFNVEKSKKFSETVMGQSDFGTFMSKGEGQGAENDSVEKTFDKSIYHIEFAKEFTITQKMADDAQMGIGADLKALPRAFTRAYYKTRVLLGANALINGTKSKMIFNRAEVDLTTGDKLPLFHDSHPYFTSGHKGKTQTNFFYGDLTSDTEKLEMGLGTLANHMRNFKDENETTLGYVADTLVIPCNRPRLEMMAKKICGSERTTGSHNNDINTQYGNWTLVILDDWQTTDDRFMIMSRAANKNLLGNMFYNRAPLNIRSGIDDHTRNNYWNGYCRMGVGFTTWKHIALAVSSTEAVGGATALA